MLNGVNAYMLFHITGHTKHEEELDHHIITFNLIWWIRARRMKWLDHILRLKNDRNGNERLVKQTVKRIHEHTCEGDLLMDLDDNISWTDMLTQEKKQRHMMNRVAKMRSTAVRNKNWNASNVTDIRYSD